MDESQLQAPITKRLNRYRQTYAAHRLSPDDIDDDQAPWINMHMVPYPVRFYTDSERKIEYVSRPWLPHSRVKCWEAYGNAWKNAEIHAVEWSDRVISFC